MSGCPFDIPKFNSSTKKVYKCTLCSDRVGQGLEPACIKSCPTGCLKFGTKTDMRALAETRARQLREHSGFPNAGVYDPPSVGGTHVIYVLHDITKPELYGGLPANPQIPVAYTAWKRVAKPIGLLLTLLAAPVAFFHYIMEGPKEPQPPSPGAGLRRAMIASAMIRSRERAAAASGLHAGRALGLRDLLRPGAALGVCDLHALALSRG